jgi:hypothetical protein
MQNRSKWWSRVSFPRVASVEEEQPLAPPPLKLWQKVLPLGVIFFIASFNLTILQVRRGLLSCLLENMSLDYLYNALAVKSLMVSRCGGPSLFEMLKSYDSS